MTKSHSFVGLKRQFFPSVLALAIGSVLVGCGGGGGGGLAATSSHITQPPTKGENNPGSGGQDTGTGGEQNPNSAYIYDPQKFNVEEPDTSLNKVGVGVLDSGVGINDYLEDSVKKVFRYIEDYQAGTLTREDLTDRGIDIQDIDPGTHGTIVAQIIAGKIPANAKYPLTESIEGIAKDIAEIYGVSTSESNNGIGYATTAYLAALNLNQEYGVKLFNGSFGTVGMRGIFHDDVTQYAARLADGGSLVVMATGNAGLAVPSDEVLLPTRNSAIEKGWLAVTGLNEEHTDLYRDTDGEGANNCGLAARWCLAADYIVGPIQSDSAGGLIMFYGTSGATPQVTSAAALVWSKYPWMSNDQVRQVLLTNADYMDDGSGLNQLYNERFGWGALDIWNSLSGPQSFLKVFNENFEANVTSNVAIFSNDIDGDAGLIKQGAGTLVMAGDSNYTGATDVQLGKLQVTGNIDSTVRVGTRGTLSGTGQTGAVVNQGTVSSKDGRLTVNGNYAQESTGTLAYSLEHYLTVKGDATLAGKLEVSAQNKGMVTEGTHQVLNANHVAGQFDSYSSTSAFLTVKGLSQTNKDVAVDVAFADAKTAGTLSGGISNASGELLNKLMAKANTQAVAGQSTQLTDYVANVQKVATATAAQAVLNSNAGALFAETPSVLLRNDTLVNAQIAQRSYQVSKQGLTGAWVTAGYLDNTSEAKGWDTVESEIKTVSAGADFKVTDHAILGAYISDYNEDSKFSASNGKSETELTTIGIYGQWLSDHNYYVAANAQYGFGDTTFDRTVTDGIKTDASHAKADLDKYGIYTEFGYALPMEQFSISPYLALSHNAVSLDQVKESSDLGVTVGDTTAKESKAHVGTRSDYQVTQQLKLGGYAEYAYAFDRSLPNVSLTSNIDHSVDVRYRAPSFDKDFLLYGLGFNYLTANSKWNIFGDVAGNALNAEDYQMQLGLKYAF